MKKIYKIACLFGILFALPLTACQKTRIQLESNTGLTSAVSLTYEEMQGKKVAEHDFVVYYYLSSCSGCAAFSPILDQYIQENGVVIYKYAYTSGTSGLDTILGSKVPDVVPSLIFVVNGKIDSTLIYSNKTASKFTEIEEFRKYMESKVILPNVAWISRETLAAKIAANDDFVVFFSLEGCADCARLNAEFLDDYMRSYKGSNRLFKIEVQPWRQYKNNSDPQLAQQWIDFAQQFQLYFNYQDGSGNIPAVTIDNYATFGDSGKVPAIQAWSNGSLSAMMVYYNDRMTLGEWPRTITGSFFSDGPIGRTFTAYSDYTSDAAILAFYNAKAKAFFDQYL